jgi:hypothetical protein
MQSQRSEHGDTGEVPASLDEPFTVRRYSRPGAKTYRILVIGDQSPRDGSSGFGQALVDRVWLRSQHGLDVDVVGSALSGLRSLHTAFTSWRVSRYDAVVVVLPPLGFRTQRRAARAMLAVLGRLLEITVVTIASDDATLPAAAARRQTTGRSPDGQSGGGPSAADVVAAQLERQLRGIETGPATPPTDGGPPPGGLGAALQDRQAELRLASIATMARDSFDVATAAVNIIDGDDLWTVAAAGTDQGRRPKSGTLCDATFHRPGLTVVPDVWADADLRELPVAQGPAAIRFYAAHALEPIGGHRLGTLCIYDPRPRDPDGFDFTMLRDLALLAEIELTDVGRPRNPS